MSRNSKQTSKRIATLAAETLQDDRASQVAKSLAASALAQRNAAKQTGTEMEDLAAKVRLHRRRELRPKRISRASPQIHASTGSQQHARSPRCQSFR